MLLLPLLIAIVACDSNGAGSAPAATPTVAAYSNSPEGKPPGLGAPVPDPKEATETVAAGKLPTFISQAAPSLVNKITSDYQGAVDHYDAYSHVPCYCGCAIY